MHLSYKVSLYHLCFFTPMPHSLAQSKDLTDSVVFGKFKVGEKLGSGAFGDIYLGWNVLDSVPVAIKVAIGTSAISALKVEALVYSTLTKASKGKISPIPQYYFYGPAMNCSMLVLELLSFSLDTLFKACHSSFSLKTTLQLADQMIERLEFMHSVGYIHRDLKPDNFMMGHGKRESHLYIIDFGLTKSYLAGNEHAIPQKKTGVVGTVRYSSVSATSNITLSRRDDLESLGYILVYFLKGALPWQSMGDSATNKWEKVGSKKMEVCASELCSDLPCEFAAYVNYTRSLHFDECPDYTYLRDLFRSLYLRSGFEYDGCYDWSSMSFKEIVGGGKVR